MSIQNVICDRCQKEFLFQSVEIKELVIDDSEHGLHFIYDYFQCPHCKKVYTVCIDDNKSLMLERDFLQLKVRTEKTRKEKGVVQESRIRMLQKKQERLGNYRQKLLDTYSKAFTKIAEINLGQEQNKHHGSNVEKEEVK